MEAGIALVRQIATNVDVTALGRMPVAAPAPVVRRGVPITSLESGQREAEPALVAAAIARMLEDEHQGSRAIVVEGVVTFELCGRRAGRYGPRHEMTPKQIWQVFREMHPNVTFPTCTDEELLIAFRTRLNRTKRKEREVEVSTSVNGMASSLSF